LRSQSVVERGDSGEAIDAFADDFAYPVRDSDSSILENEILEFGEIVPVIEIGVDLLEQ
jgi:hypothetical protein